MDNNTEHNNEPSKTCPVMKNEHFANEGLPPKINKNFPQHPQGRGFNLDTEC